MLNTWTGLAGMPSPVEQAAGVYAPNTGKFDVFGGNAASEFNLTRIYNPGTNAWTPPAR